MFPLLPFKLEPERFFESAADGGKCVQLYAFDSSEGIRA